MKVTDKQYYMEDKLVQKLDLMVERTQTSKFDNVVLIDGDEGYGKSNMAVACAYYVAKKMGKEFTVDNVFFDPNKFMEYAGSTENQVIVWDEAALMALASDWQNKLQKKLIQFLMVARKKRHFFFFNVPKFFRLNEYFVIDRPIALIHVYARKETQLGRFVYFKKQSKNNLYYEIKRTKRRNYDLFYNFHGTFPECISLLIDEEAYESKKDDAIAKLVRGDDAKGRMDVFNLKLRYKVSQLPVKLGMSLREFGILIGMGYQTIAEWQGIKEKYPEIFEIT